MSPKGVVTPSVKSISAKSELFEHASASRLNCFHAICNAIETAEVPLQSTLFGLYPVPERERNCVDSLAGSVMNVYK